MRGTVWNEEGNRGWADITIHKYLKIKKGKIGNHPPNVIVSKSPPRVPPVSSFFTLLGALGALRVLGGLHYVYKYVHYKVLTMPE